MCVCVCVCVCLFDFVIQYYFCVCAREGGGGTEELRKHVAACHALKSCERVGRNRLSSSGVLDHDVDLDQLD